MTLDALRAGGKPALARALAALEARPDAAETARLLDAAYAQPVGLALGLTGPPGVGKSTLTGALIRTWRAQGQTVGVIAVDPSSRASGGALLGDRTRFATDPEDSGVFVRSMAARDRLGGVAELTFPALVLMRALFDRVIVETVGVGQSETEIAGLADLVMLCVQPGAGDGVQFMKAGVMEIPDLIAVTKADIGAPARRAVAEIRGALSLVSRGDGKAPPEVLAVSATTGTGIDALQDALSRTLSDDAALAARRGSQAEAWIESAVRAAFGARGWARVAPRAKLACATEPFIALLGLSSALEACLNGAKL